MPSPTANLGQYASLADYMAEIGEQTIAIPEAVRFYIDWEAMGRDAELNGEVFTPRTEHEMVHVFAG